MSYEKKISLQLPGLILLLLDDSGSMKEHMFGTTDVRFQWVERYVGIIFKDLLTKSADVKGDQMVIKPRYYIYIILYGSRPGVWGDGQMDIETAVERYTQSNNSLGLGGKLCGTDARAAFQVAHDFLKSAVTQEPFKNAFPPMLFHLTDGESHTDASDVAEQIKELATCDGNVLLVNAYIGTQTSLNYTGPEDFAGYIDASEAGPSADNIRMFNMSSEVPTTIRHNLIDDGIFPELREGARLFFDIRTKESLKHAIQVVGSLGSRAERRER